jgi:solute carrier family 41
VSFGGIIFSQKAKLSETKANVGDLDDRVSRYGILQGNMALLQVQATLVSLIASILSFVLGAMTPDPTPEGPAAAEGSAMLMHLLARKPRPKPVYDPTKPKSGLAEYVCFILPSVSSG